MAYTLASSFRVHWLDTALSAFAKYSGVAMSTDNWKFPDRFSDFLDGYFFSIDATGMCADNLYSGHDADALNRDYWRIQGDACRAAERIAKTDIESVAADGAKAQTVEATKLIAKYIAQHADRRR